MSFLACPVSALTDRTSAAASFWVRTGMGLGALRTAEQGQYRRRSGLPLLLQNLFDLRGEREKLRLRQSRHPLGRRPRVVMAHAGEPADSVLR